MTRLHPPSRCLLCTAVFTSAHRFPGVFIDVGHKILIFPCWSNSFVDLDVCYGSLLWWKMTFQLKHDAAAAMLQRSYCALLVMCITLDFFAVIPSLVIFPHAFRKTGCILFWKTSKAWVFFSAKKGFCVATLPHSTDIWRIWRLLSHAVHNQILPELPAAPLMSLQASWQPPRPVFLLSLHHFLRGVQFLIKSLLCHIISTRWWLSPLCSMVYLIPWGFCCTLLLTDTFQQFDNL